MSEVVKLTEAQRESLECCPDWSASFEIKERREEKFGSRTTWQRQQDVMRRLEQFGLAEFGEPNATYRITDAGRAMLSAAQATP